MFAQNETFLSTVDRLGSRLGPLNRVVNTLVERLLPQAIAEAACNTGWTFCYSECDADTYCQRYYHLNRRYDWYGRNRAECLAGNATRACNAGCACDI